MHDLRLEYYLGIKRQGRGRRAGDRARGRDAGTQCVMVGDDLPDVPLMQRVGWPIAVGRRARPRCSALAQTVTRRRGGTARCARRSSSCSRHNGTWDAGARALRGARDADAATGAAATCCAPTRRARWCASRRAAVARARGAARPTSSSRAVELLAACRGKVIVSGVGKSGLLAHKIAATLTSTGTPGGVPAPGRRAARRRRAVRARRRRAVPLEERRQRGAAGAAARTSSATASRWSSIVAQPRLGARARAARVALVTGPGARGLPDGPDADHQHHAGAGDGRLPRGRAARAARVPARGLPLPASGRRASAARASRRVEELMHAGRRAAARAPRRAALREVMLEIMDKRLGITTRGRRRRAGSRRGQRRRLQAHPAAARRIRGRSPPPTS